MSTQIEVRLFDGRGDNLIRAKKEVLLSVRDGNDTSFHRAFVAGPTIAIPATFQDNFQDNHTILASLKGHRDAGLIPVPVRKDQTSVVNLMLLPRNAEFEFASIAGINNSHEALAGLLNRTFGDAAPRQYEELQGRRPELACVMNIVEALAIVELPKQGGFRQTLAHYIDRLDTAPALDWLRPDRCFAWCSADIATTVRRLPHLFKRAQKVLHPGATDSFKQFGFGEANVQVTLHENDRGTVGDQELIKVEFDIDYFRDNAAHLLLEVFPNTLKKLVFGADSAESLTDPAIAYGLRWIAGRQPTAAAQIRPFAPAYSIKPMAS